MNAKRYGYRVIPLVAFLIIVFFLWRGLDLDPKKIPSPLVNQPLPEFQLPDLFEPGLAVTTQDLQGEIAVLNVWATWCLPCRAEHPLLVKLSKTGVPIYGINYKDQRDKALKWLELYGDPYRRVMMDPQGQTGIDFGVYGVPETFLLDAQGRIRYKHVGALKAEDLEQVILPKLNELRRESK